MGRKTVNRMVKEQRLGKTGINTLENGEMGKNMGRELSLVAKVANMRGNGRTGKKMDKDPKLQKGEISM